MSVKSPTKHARFSPSTQGDVGITFEVSRVVDGEPRIPACAMDAGAVGGELPVSREDDLHFDLVVAEDLPYGAAKRALDIIGSAFLLVVTAPIWLAAALAVKISDLGPIFYVHKRVGEGGREFTCYKFRSMTIDADRLKADLAAQNRHNDPRTFKMEHDPRITRVGRLLRKLSIDELPQLWNVLNGDMSLVGPRAPIPEEVEMYSRRDRQRLSVRPGLTCIWQVSGRSNLPFPDQVPLDLEYIQRRSLTLDLKLILLTVPAVLSCRGAC